MDTPLQTEDWYAANIARRLSRIATATAMEIETLGGRLRERLITRTLESAGAEGDAVRAFVRLSRALSAFAAESMVDDADWQRHAKGAAE